MVDTLKIIDDSIAHGRRMYIQALEHAISMFELAGEDAIDRLKKRLEDEKKELEQMESGRE